MGIKDFIQAAVGLTVLFTFAYTFYKIEFYAYKNIDNLKARLIERFNNLEKHLAVHIAKYEERLDKQNYMNGALNEKIDHKFNRCWEEIKNKSN